MAGFGYRILGFGAGCAGPAYIEATGGNETVTDGDYKIHIFTGDGNLCVTSKGRAAGSNQADYLVVAGGGGGGQGTGGGGGGGGFRISSGTASRLQSVPSPLGGCVPGIGVTLGAMPITVGAGGTGRQPGGPAGTLGGDSIFGSITSTGGGVGSGGDGTPNGPTNGRPGGSGGGAHLNNPSFGNGNDPPTSPLKVITEHHTPGYVGGGAVEPVKPVVVKSWRKWSSELTLFRPQQVLVKVLIVLNIPVVAAVGSDQTSQPGGNGGPGGGGRGGNRQNSPTVGVAGTANTGGGGGGRGLPPGAGLGNSGGSGVVVIRYKFQN